MPIVYEVPTHLNVDDTVVFGLTAAQLVRFSAAGSLAYGIWDQATMLPPEVRLVMAGLVAAAGLACAVFRPGERPLDQWVVVFLIYLLQPGRLAWRREPARPGSPADGPGWAELAPDVDWATARFDRPDAFHGGDSDL
jgi:hypothetical protein